jgi:hypothetical protein
MDALAALIQSLGPGHVQTRRFSQPKGREPKRGPSQLGLQATPSCSARMGMVVVMLLWPHRDMVRRGATAPDVAGL